MKKLGMILAVCALAGAMAGATPAQAAEGARKKEEPKDLIFKGDAKCTRCHEENDSPQQLAIAKTRHGVTADGRTPTCVSCHGESDAHLEKPEGQDRPKPDRYFAKHSSTPVETRNEACLACHQGGPRIHWQTGAHATSEVACTSCHKMHTAHDDVRDKRTQPAVCFECHKEQRVQVSRISRHPINEGKMGCSDCHNPHGSPGVKMLVRDSVVDTCYTCHMEKRGPFVRTHQPVQEDCSICHNPHGSPIAPLLKARSPYLCQDCHEPSGHRTIPGSLQQNSVYTNALARGCLNCHTNIHGTNNPANVANERTFRR